VYWLIKSSEQGNDEATRLLKETLSAGRGKDIFLFPGIFVEFRLSSISYCCFMMGFLLSFSSALWHENMRLFASSVKI